MGSIGVPFLSMHWREKDFKPTEPVPLTTMSVYVPGSKSKGGRMINPYAYTSPPFVGTWNDPVGMGVKKRRGQGLLLGKNSPFNSIPVLGTIL